MDNSNGIRIRPPGGSQEGHASADGIATRLMKRDEAAAYLHSSIDTLDRLCRERKVPYYRIGRSVRLGNWDLVRMVSDRFVAAEEFVGNVDQVLTKRQLADFLSVSTRTIENLMNEHRLWHRKVRGMVRFRLGDVLAQLDNQFRVAATEGGSR